DTVIHRAIDENNVAGLAGVNFSIKGFSGNVEYLRAENQFFTGGNPSIKPTVGPLQKAKFAGSRVYELNLLNGKFKTLELNTAFDWESSVSEVVGIKADTLGVDKITLIETDVDARANEYKTYVNTDFIYQPVENKLKAGLGLKMAIGDFSVEPGGSFYYETKPLLKVDAKSKTTTLTVNSAEQTVTATQYDDAERRTQVLAAVVWNSPLNTPLVSGLRVKAEYERLFINDLNDYDVDSTKWNKNDGYQQRIKGSVSNRFLKRRFSNKLDASYKYKEKKDRGEKKTTYNVSDKFTVDVVPRKLSLGINGYYLTTGTEYSASTTETQTLYGGESELKYSLSSMLSVSGKGGYEYGYDDAASGSENYKTFYGGVTANYLF
ncbi:MAG: hypothetical protein V1913_01805, partial [Fibrobacterota bacterium]